MAFVFPNSTGKSKLQDDPVKGQLMEVAQVVKTAKDDTKTAGFGGCLLLLQSQVILEKVPQGAAGALEKASWTKGLGKCLWQQKAHSWSWKRPH